MLEQIKASAGSGKTYTLTRRFLERLRDAAKGGGLPSCALSRDPAAPYALAEILAATFTNKAAAEMKSRVLRDLKALALGVETDQVRLQLFTPQEARAWVETILRRFDALNIRTIDSLLALLVRLSALSLDLPPDFSPVFDDDELFSPLYDALLDSAARGDIQTREILRDACRALLLHGEIPGFMPGDRLKRRLREVVTLSLRTELPLPDAKTLDNVHARRTVLRQDLAQSAAALLPLLAEEKLNAASHFLAFTHKCAALEQHGPLPDSEYARKAELDDCLLKASKGKASEDARAAFAYFCAAHARTATLDPLYRAALELGPFALLAAPLALALTTLQQEEGKVPAALLPRLAGQVVSGEAGVSDAFCRLGNRLSHLLFDEFQDTSRDQWAAIAPLAVEALSRGGSLTYVGDVKQAIYSWRGGDAALFDDVLHDAELTAMLDKGPGAITLACNWRSAPAIVRHNNMIFSRLGEEGTAQAVTRAMLADGAPSQVFARAAATLGRSFTHAAQNLPPHAAENPDQGLVRLTRVSAADNAELQDEVARRLHGLLDELLERHDPRDIAILVRRNAEASQMAALLTEWGLPVVTEHSFQLGRHPLIGRLTDFLAFLEYPPDDTAFWSFVSGPECFIPLSGLAPEQLTDWLAAVRARPGSISLAQAFRRDFPRQWEALIAPFHDQAGLMSAYDTIQESIRRFDLFKRLPEHAPFLRRFLEVAHAAEGKGHSSLSAFLDYWESSGVEEKVPMPEGMDAVRILTMHKAKGLEFPVVIVPFHHHADPADSPIIPAKVEGLPLLVRRTKHLGAPYYEARIHSALEALNLLYVAWTRPTQELHAFITGTTRSQGTSGLSKALEILLLDLPFTDGVYETGALPEARRPARTASPASTLSPPVPVADLDPFWRPMHWLPRLKIFRNSLEDLEFTERRRGMLAHSCLEALCVSGDPGADAEQAVRHGLMTFPLPVPDAEGVFREMRAMLGWFASLPQTPHWLDNGAPEQSIMDESGNLHRVDLLVDEGDAGLLTVEYKTGKSDRAHTAQVRRYLGLLRAATDRPARGVLVYLDERRLEEVA